MSKSYEFCTVEKDGHLTVITMNRPEVMNALHYEADLELNEVFDDFRDDADQWVAIVTGAGVNGGVKFGHCGGAKVGQFGASALERAALI